MNNNVFLLLLLSRYMSGSGNDTWDIIGVVCGDVFRCNDKSTPLFFLIQRTFQINTTRYIHESEVLTTFSYGDFPIGQLRPFSSAFKISLRQGSLISFPPHSSKHDPICIYYLQ